MECFWFPQLPAVMYYPLDSIGIWFLPLHIWNGNWVSLLEDWLYCQFNCSMHVLYFPFVACSVRFMVPIHCDHKWSCRWSYENVDSFQSFYLQDEDVALRQICQILNGRFPVMNTKGTVHCPSEFMWTFSDHF
jgi:hypothetical protein